MPLAVASYQNLPALEDQPQLLNLAWTLDERTYLSTDLFEVVRQELLQEACGSERYIEKYFVRDPYGEAVLGSAVARYFSAESWPLHVSCGAGVDSLLHALAPLTRGGPLYVIGDVYPDLPHWVNGLGQRCVGAAAASPGQLADDIRASGAALVLLERPALVGAQLELAQLEELCQGMAPDGRIVLVDESYANYSPPADSAVQLLPRVSNLVVMRGLSKAYWLGSLRLGYCVTAPKLTPAIRALLPPMMASSLSLRLGRAVLQLGDLARPLRDRIAENKQEMREQLTNSSLARFLPSAEHVPYLFCSSADSPARLQQRGILGKAQPFFSGEARAPKSIYRLSVPLLPERMASLRARCSDR